MSEKHISIQDYADSVAQSYLAKSFPEQYKNIQPIQAEVKSQAQSEQEFIQEHLATPTIVVMNQETQTTSSKIGMYLFIGLHTTFMIGFSTYLYFKR
jgi:hypothetical protein